MRPLIRAAGALALASLLSAPLAGQAPEVPATAPAEKPAPKTVPVVLTTSAGAITIALEVERAPITAGNFLRYVDQHRLDGTTFYRAFTYAGDPPLTGFIQGGAQNNPKRILKSIAHEPTTQTGLTHDDGAISMARGAPGTADGDFFILMGSIPGFDADPKAPGDNQGFAVFGHVVQGMDVVRAIAGMSRDPVKGVGAMKGQMLAAPVKILTARRVVVPGVGKAVK